MKIDPIFSWDPENIHYFDGEKNPNVGRGKVIDLVEGPDGVWRDPHPAIYEDEAVNLDWKFLGRVVSINGTDIGRPSVFYISHTAT